MSGDRVGTGHERTYETKAYGVVTCLTCLDRADGAQRRRRGPGAPRCTCPRGLRGRADREADLHVDGAGVDLSLSMPMRDNFLAAKKVAMPCTRSSRASIPRDYLGLVGFGEFARELRPEQLPEVVLGLRLRHQHEACPRAGPTHAGPPVSTKQIILITDGEPTADIQLNGEPRSSATRLCRRPSRSGRPRWSVHPGREPHQHLHAGRDLYLRIRGETEPAEPWPASFITPEAPVTTSSSTSSTRSGHRDVAGAPPKVPACE